MGHAHVEIVLQTLPQLPGPVAVDEAAAHETVAGGMARQERFLTRRVDKSPPQNRYAGFRDVVGWCENRS